MQVTFIKPTLGRLDNGERFVDEARMDPPCSSVSWRD